MFCNLASFFLPIQLFPHGVTFLQDIIYSEYALSEVAVNILSHLHITNLWMCNMTQNNSTLGRIKYQRENAIIMYNLFSLRQGSVNLVLLNCVSTVVLAHAGTTDRITANPLCARREKESDVSDNSRFSHS